MTAAVKHELFPESVGNGKLPLAYICAMFLEKGDAMRRYMEIGNVPTNAKISN